MNFGGSLQPHILKNSHGWQEIHVSWDYHVWKAAHELYMAYLRVTYDFHLGSRFDNLKREELEEFGAHSKRRSCQSLKYCCGSANTLFSVGFPANSCFVWALAPPKTSHFWVNKDVGYTIASSFRVSRLLRAYSLDTMRFIDAVSRPTVDWHGRWYLGLASAIFLGFSFVPAALWSGALTPIVAEKTVSRMIKISTFVSSNYSDVEMFQAGK